MRPARVEERRPTTDSIVSSSTPKTMVAEQRPQLGLLGVEQRARRGLVGGLGREPDLEALDAAGEEGEGGVAECGRARSMRPASRSARPDSDSPQVRRVRRQDRRRRRRRGARRSGSTAPLDDLLHLVGHARARRRSPCRPASGRSGPGAVPGCGSWMAVAPAGTSAWRRLLSGIRRPARREHRPDARRRPPRRGTSSTPITSAMASRVMSSWVGPSPPHTMHGVARSRACRSAATMRPGCRRPSSGSGSRCRRGRAARRSRRVGVDDLPEQQLGADGDDLADHARSADAARADAAGRCWRPGRRRGTGCRWHRQDDRDPQHGVGDPQLVARRPGRGQADGDLLDHGLHLGPASWPARRGRAGPSTSGTPGCRARGR